MNNNEFTLIQKLSLLKVITLSNNNDNVEVVFNTEDSVDTSGETVLETSIGVDDSVDNNQNEDSMSNVVLLMGIIIIVLAVTVVALVSVLYNKNQNEKLNSHNRSTQERHENAPSTRKKVSTANKVNKKNSGMPSIESKGAGNVNSTNRIKPKNNKVQDIKTNKSTNSVSQYDDIEKAICDAEHGANKIKNPSVTHTSIDMDLADSPTIYTDIPNSVEQSSLNMENKSNSYDNTSVSQQNPTASNVPTRAVPQQNPMASNVPTRAVPQQNPMTSNVPVQAVPQQNPMTSNVPVRAVPQQSPMNSNVPVSSVSNNIQGSQGNVVKTPIVPSNETQSQVQGFSDSATMNICYNSANTNNASLKYIKYSNNTMFNLRFGKECEILLEDSVNSDTIFVLVDDNKVYINPMYLNNIDKRSANNLLVYNINAIFNIKDSAQKGIVSHITGCIVRKTDRGYEMVQKGVIS